jgi:putative ABC transport system substrate-binding protein
MSADTMHRRSFLTLLGGAAAAWPVAARAQQSKRIGVLMNGEPTVRETQSHLAAFEDSLRRLGWMPGQNLQSEIRWNDGDAQRARAYAAELVTLAPDVILAASTTNLSAMRLATRTIPIVFASVSDPVVQGFVPSLMRPGGNITGFAAYEFSIAGKWLDLLKQMVPALAQVSVVFKPDTSPQSQHFLRAINSAAQLLGVGVALAPVRSPAEIETAIVNAASQPNNGLLFPTDSYTQSHSMHIAEVVARHPIPGIYASRTYVADGGLMFYGVSDITAHYRAAATYIDRILKGAKPGDLPVQLPTRYSLVINLKAAKALGHGLRGHDA